MTKSLSPTGAGAATERAFGLEIARDGTWWHQGSPIGRMPLVKLFATVLRREADGSYWLVTPVERGRIAVEDVPFVAVELAATGRGRDAAAAPAHQSRRVGDGRAGASVAGPRQRGRGRGDEALVPYVEVRPGLEARLARAVYYQLVELGEELDGRGGTRFGVWSGGRFFALDRAG